jgi:hypothetical protein
MDQHTAPHRDTTSSRLGSGREGLKVKEIKEERCASVDTSAAGGGTGWSAAPRGEDFTASVVRRRVGNGRGFGARFRGDIYRLEWVNAEWVAGLQNKHRPENIVQYWTFELKSLRALLAAYDSDSFFYLKRIYAFYLCT